MGKKKTAVLVGVVVLIVVAAAVYYFFFRPSQPPGIIDNALPEESVPAGEQGREEPVQPIEVELSKSDELVRKLAAELSAHPSFTKWLMTDYLIRRFTATVDLIAKGDSPRRPMDFIEFEENFPVLEEDGRLYLDPAGYQRYVGIAAVIMSLDAKGCATLYKQLQLPIQQAYREMGYPEEDFDATLRKAIFKLLETPVVEGKIYLEKDVVTYKFVDPELENLSAAQKHLLRMGPDNMTVIQAKLMEIAGYLGYSMPESVPE